jgi:integrase
MSVRKRTWKRASDAELRTAWIVDYRDGAGKRRAKQFDRKKDADAWEARTKVDVADGVHVADRATVTVAEAGALWLEAGEAAGLERTTMDQRRQHLKFHIKPFIGAMKLNKISIAVVRGFQDKLRSSGRSPDMVKRVTTSLSGILSEAQERGLAAQNPIRGRRRSAAEKRHKKRLEVGIDIPTPQEIRALIEALTGRWRPILLTAIFTGLRASELRGLSWRDVDLQSAVLHVRQRADRYKKIGSPKTDTSKRRIPLSPIVVNTLREWKLACPKGELDLVFPNAKGEVEWHGIIVTWGLLPALRAAKLCDPVIKDGKPVLDDDGNPVMKPRYAGLHALRHFYASWCINRKADGGLELSAKLVQERLGHATLAMTTDTYGHLFPSADDGAEMAAAEIALLRTT